MPGGPRRAGDRPVRLTVVTATKGRHDAVVAKAHAMRGAAAEAAPFGGLEWRLWVNERPRDVETLRDRLAALDLPCPVTVDGGEDLPVGAARNTVVSAARGDLVWLSDDDCVPLPGACAAHLAFHARTSTDQDERTWAERGRRVGIGRLVLPDALRRGRAREPFERVLAPAGRLTWIALTGANSSMATAAYRAVGGFDPSWTAYGGDDHDFALRLAAEGATFHRVTGGTVEHHGRVWDDADKAYRAGRSHVEVARRHPRSGAGWWLGVNPTVARLKRRWFTGPFARALDPTSSRYEAAYAQGALDAWADDAGATT